jgi:beta-N-acetylhexosaminidase
MAVALAACAGGSASAPAAPVAVAPLVIRPVAVPLRPALAGDALDADVERILASLTLEEKVGQLVMGYPPAGDGPVRYGAVIVMGKVLREPAQVRVRVEALQRRARVPLLVAVDLEGGALNRLRAVPTSAALPSAREMGEEGAWEAEAWGRRAGLDMRALGLNCALGPVLDLADRGFMHETGRSLGADADRVARLGRAFARGLAGAGVVAIGKHYPGYGPVAESSDLTRVVVERSPQEIARHQAAFVAAADVLGGVMLANVGFRAYGGEPAVFSPELVARAHLSGFLTVTDDLAVPTLRGPGEDAAGPIRRAFLAGNDVLLTTAPAGWEGAPDPVEVVLAMVRERPALARRVDESVRRVLRAKARAGLLEAPPPAAGLAVQAAAYR